MSLPRNLKQIFFLLLAGLVVVVSGLVPGFSSATAAAAVTITATPPTFTDKSGATDDTYTVPTKVGIAYSVGGVVTTAGTHPGTGTVTITAGAESGYVLDGTATWTHEFTSGGMRLESFVATQPSCETIKVSFDYFSGPGEWVLYGGTGAGSVKIASGSVLNAEGSVSDVVSGQPAGTYGLMLLGSDPNKADGEATVTIDACVTPSTTVTPNPPTFTDKTGTIDDTYTGPSTTGVEYSVGGVVTAAGTYPGTGLVTVTAAPKPGYVLAGTTTWAFQFTDVVLPVPTTTAPTTPVPTTTAPTTAVPTTAVPTTTAPTTAFPTTTVPTPSPSVTAGGVVASGGSGGQTDLNPGFAALTGWGEVTSTQGGVALVAVVLLAMATITSFTFYRRRKTGEQ